MGRKVLDLVDKDPEEVDIFALLDCASWLLQEIKEKGKVQ